MGFYKSDDEWDLPTLSILSDISNKWTIEQKYELNAWWRTTMKQLFAINEMILPTALNKFRLGNTMAMHSLNCSTCSFKARDCFMLVIYDISSAVCQKCKQARQTPTWRQRSVEKKNGFPLVLVFAGKLDKSIN